MSTLAPPAEPERDPRVKAVFDDIRATRRTDCINNLGAPRPRHARPHPASLAARSTCTL